MCIYTNQNTDRFTYSAHVYEENEMIAGRNIVAKLARKNFYLTFIRAGSITQLFTHWIVLITGILGTPNQVLHISETSNIWHQSLNSFIPFYSNPKYQSNCALQGSPVILPFNLIPILLKYILHSLIVTRFGVVTSYKVYLIFFFFARSLSQASASLQWGEKCLGSMLKTSLMLWEKNCISSTVPLLLCILWCACIDLCHGLILFFLNEQEINYAQKKWVLSMLNHWFDYDWILIYHVYS